MTSAPARIASSVAPAAARSWSGVRRSPVAISTTLGRPPGAVEVVGLVQVALRLDELDLGSSLRIGLSQRPCDAPELEGRQVIAGEVADEVRGTDDECSVVSELHACNRSSGSCQLACRGRATIEP